MTTYRVTVTLEVEASSAEQAADLIAEGEGHALHTTWPGAVRHG